MQTKTHLWIFIAVAVAGSLLYFLFDPAVNRFFPPCPFHTLTGFFCPGCGSQRAFHDILHGHLLQAASHNILFLLFTPLMLFAGVVAANNVLRKKKVEQRLFNSTIFTKAVLIAVVSFWILRNLPLRPFSMLAPE